MRRKDREVKDFETIVNIIDECDIVRIGIADGKKYEMLKKVPLCSFELDIPLGIDCVVSAKDVTMRYKSVMGKCQVEFIEDNKEKIRIIDDVIMARYEETKHFDYNKNSISKTAIAKLTVIELSAKVNPIGGGADI